MIHKILSYNFIGALLIGLMIVAMAPSDALAQNAASCVNAYSNSTTDKGKQKTKKIVTSIEKITKTINARLDIFQLKTSKAISGLASTIVSTSANQIETQGNLMQAQLAVESERKQRYDNIELAKETSPSATDCVQATAKQNYGSMAMVTAGVKDAASNHFREKYDTNRNNIARKANQFDYWLRNICQKDNNRGLVPTEDKPLIDPQGNKVWCGMDRAAGDDQIANLSAGDVLMGDGTLDIDSMGTTPVLEALSYTLPEPSETIGLPAHNTMGGKGLVVANEAYKTQAMLVADYRSHLFSLNAPAGVSGPWAREVLMGNIGAVDSNNSSVNNVIEYINTIPDNISMNQFMEAYVTSITGLSQAIQSQQMDGYDLDRAINHSLAALVMLEDMQMEEARWRNVFQAGIYGVQIGGVGNPLGSSN